MIGIFWKGFSTKNQGNFITIYSWRDLDFANVKPSSGIQKSIILKLWQWCVLREAVKIKKSVKFFTRWVLTEDLNFFSILTASLIIISTMMWDVGGSPDRVPLLVVVICPNYQLPFSIIQITLIGRNLHFQSKSASDLRFERNYNLPDPLYCFEQTRYPGNKKNPLWKLLEPRICENNLAN